MSKVHGINPEELGLEIGNYVGKSEIHVVCPVHGGSGKSASFNYKTGVLFCFSCGAKLTAKEIKKITGGEIIENFFSERAKDDYGRDWERTLDSPLAYNNQYLIGRGVTNEQVEEFGIRVSKKGIVFPVADKGIVVRQLNSSIRYLYGGQRSNGWGLEILNEINPIEDKLIICEGIFGALRGRKYGYNVIASLGSNVHTKLSSISRSFYNTIGIFDNDDAGYKAGIRLLKQNPSAQIVVPGAEVDEAEEYGWKFLVEESKKTSDIEELREHMTTFDKRSREIIHVGKKNYTRKRWSKNKF